MVASPCALVISTPASTLSGLANAARNGILFKGSAALEDIGETRTIAFDKTGTLTYGRPALTDVVALGRRLERGAACCGWRRARSGSPSTTWRWRSCAGRASAALPLAEAVAFRAFPGKGIAAEVDGDEVLVGNDMLFAEFGVAVPAAAVADGGPAARRGEDAPSSSGIAQAVRGRDRRGRHGAAERAGGHRRAEGAGDRAAS